MVNLRGANWRLWSVGHKTPRSLHLFRFGWKSRRGLHDGRYPLYEVTAALRWEPRDMWVGCYWTPSDYGKVLVYICLIPCVPLRLHFKRIYGTGGVA